MTNAVIDTFPAYDILKNERLHWQSKRPIIKHGDQIAFQFESRRYGPMWKMFTVGSAASYALENDECPIESYNRELSRGYKTHWVNANAVSITAEKREKEFYYGFEFGDQIHFEGRVFEFVKEANNNVGLKEVEAA